MTMDVSDTQPMKVAYSIRFTSLGIFTDSKLLQSLNTDLPIYVTVSGKVTLFKPERLLNALSAILTTEYFSSPSSSGSGIVSLPLKSSSTSITSAVWADKSTS